MSTKIYTAYRLKNPAKLWEVVRDIKKRGTENVRKELRNVYEAVMAEIDPNSDEYLRLRATRDDWGARHSMAHDLVRERYRAQVTLMERNTFHFDVSVGIWEYEGRMYFIPFCDMLMGDVLDFMKEDKRLVDFCYWNNTDEPEGISRRTWKKRGDIWDAIDKAGWDNHLTIDVCYWNNFWRIDPWWDDATEYGKKLREAKASLDVEGTTP
jgi:hypothetical protein